MTAAPSDASLIDILAARAAEGGIPEFDPIELVRVSFPDLSVEEVAAALDALCLQGLLERATKWVCPVCDGPLSVDDLDARRCPRCTTDYRETGDEPTSRPVYRTKGGPSRDIQWVIVAHGMNTLGPWQEDLSWRLSNKLRYSAPILIHKYGLVRLGVLFRFRHRQLVHDLGGKIRRASRFAETYDRRRAPDVILHSFGTLLFAKLLDDPGFNDLRFGRVILAGSIVRPDHPWKRHIDNGRVEGILNHCGSKDWIVDLAAWLIPDTGPSGRIGFRDRDVCSLTAEGYDHSLFFQGRGLHENLGDGGLWDRFLRVPLAALCEPHMDPKSAGDWRALPFPFRRLALYVLVPMVLFLGVVCAGLLLCLVRLVLELVHGSPAV